MKRAPALLLAAALIPFGAVAAPAETLLLDALSQQRDGDDDAARKTLQTLLQQQPHFQLARWLRDARPELRCDDPADIVDDMAAGWREEACLRRAAQAERPPPDWRPDALIQLTPRTRQVIAVDLSLARLYLFRVRGHHLHLLREDYVAMGRDGYGKREAGDLRTPLGVYRIERWLDGRRLPPLYGAGALTLDYPNRWDRIRGRDGDGIWLHGVPADTYVRAPHSSEGCLTMANEDLRALRRDVRDGETLVVISDRLDWLDPDDFAAMRDRFVARIEDWKTRRTATDPAAYRALYSADFDRDGQDTDSFRVHKRAIGRDAPSPALTVSDLELLRFPDIDEGTLVRARFLLRGEDGGARRVEQVWRQEGAGWKILREDFQPA